MTFVFISGGLFFFPPTRSLRLFTRLEALLDPAKPLFAVLVGLTVASLLSVVWNELLATQLFGLAQIRPVLVWFFLVLIQLWVILFVVFPDKLHQSRTLDPRLAARFLWIVLLPSILLAITLSIVTPFFVDLRRFGFLFSYSLAGLAFLAGMGWLQGWHRGRSWYTTAHSYLTAAIIFCVFFMIYRLSAVLVNNIFTPSKSYFDELAYAVLNGRLYLENPTSTMDLTLFQGKWYVAFPPLATILMLPLAILNGEEGINTVNFTIFFSAVNTSLVYLMLHEISRRGWSRLRTKDNLWLIALFGLSTIHWYSAFNGKVWYISRLLALTFILTAVVLVLKRKSPWLIGLAIGLTVLARPNTIFIYPFLLGIRWQNLVDSHAFQIRELIPWVLKTAVPVAAMVGLLLGYNWLRFGDWFDFGYATMNVGVNNEVLKTYGQFNPAFIPFNLYYMWLSLPYFSDSCFNRLIPNPQGISMLLTTPAMVYLVKSFRKSIWVAGAWAAIIFQIGLLSLHTGYAWEFGYRFLLDFIIPVIALIAVASGSRMSWFQKALILAGVVVNLWGVLWYYDVLCSVK